MPIRFSCGMRSHTTRSGIKGHPICIALVDSEPAARYGVRGYFQTQADLRVCSEFDSVVQAEAQIPAIRPDLVFVDSELDGGGGLHLVNHLSKLPLRIPCIAWLRKCRGVQVLAALRAGAKGVVARNESLEELFLAAVAVCAGYRHVSLAACMAISEDQISGTLRREKLSRQLPPRQNQVFRLLGEGVSPSSIARRLGISLKTVQSHVERLKERLKCGSQIELCRKAFALRRA
jgi:DNA-binding NarL/FixJ family response regulator